MYYDAHHHLDLTDNMPELINQLKYSDLSVFAVGTTPKAYSREVQFCINACNIYVGLGMHPQLVSSEYDDIKLFKSLFGKTHYIGEVGLDFSKEYIQTKASQIKVFSEIIELCEQCGEKVVSIHSLKSASTVIEILRAYKKQKNNKYIFHWFTGSMSQLEKAIEMGCYFSINPKMLTTKIGLEVIRAIPIDYILLETDAPFTFKVKSKDEIERELRKMIMSISNVVGMDISDAIYKNSKEVFQY